MICRTRGLTEWHHRFSQCRQVHKWKYINAKSEVLRRSQQKWVAKFDACFRCDYEDLVMQTVFAQFEVTTDSDWCFQRFSVRFNTVEECLTWAGGSGQLGNAKCVKGVEVFFYVLREWSRHTQ